MFTPLAAKLHIPAPRQNSVARPRLLARLDTHPIALISAPAGAGKSTLLADWAAQTDRAVAWVSLDDDDNDPARFWSYLVTALHSVTAHAGQALLHALNSGSDAALQPLLIDLLNDLNRAERPGALVLDDYHAILAPDIHDGVRFLLEHLPATLRVVIATRVDPPLPLARWRVRDQLTELRGSDLQFTRDEAASFLARTMGLSLTAEQSQALTDRTEGWIAGLQLAALSLRGADDAPRVIAALTGAHQHVLDYLVEEVLAAQSADVQTFLMQTAILDRFCAPLCDAVLDRADSADVLIKLDKDNLFLVPLDAERQWFRYHRLFAELLRARLVSLRPTAPAQLHAKAAEWFEAAGSPEEAIGHALAAGKFDRAAQLIEHAWEAPLHAGQIVTVQRWLDALPVAALDARPLLRAAYGWTLVLRGRHAEAEPQVLAAEAALAAEPDETRTPLHTRTQAEIACLRSLIARVRGQAEEAQRYAEQAIALAPPESALLRGNAYVVLGQVYFDQGQLDRALAAYREALPLTLAGRSFVAVSLTRTYAALALRQQGRLHEAAAACREGLQLAAELGFEHLPAVSVIDVTLATILYEWNELAEAERYAAHAYELGRRGGYAEGQRVGGALLAKIRLAHGQLTEAGELLTELAAAPQSGAAAGIALLIDVQVRQRLALGEPEAALRLAGSLAEKVQSAPIIARTGAALILARALLAAGRTAEAYATLEECAATLEAHGHRGALIEALVVRARTLAALNQAERAQADLRRALTLAAPEGYVRVFVDEGQAVRSLLLELKDRLEPQTDEQLIRYAARLLAAFSPDDDDLESRLPPSANEALIEPLTDRELEVLRLMADGLTNSEIAAKLIVAESTVKKHINHLFDKLNAQTRVQAINTARHLGLI